jgi:hypothetical protein
MLEHWIWQCMIKRVGKGPLNLQKRNKTRGGVEREGPKKRLHILFDLDIKAFEGWKAWLSRGPSQHVRDSLNGATLKRQFHLYVM